MAPPHCCHPVAQSAQQSTWRHPIAATPSPNQHSSRHGAIPSLPPRRPISTAVDMAPSHCRPISTAVDMAPSHCRPISTAVEMAPSHCRPISTAASPGRGGPREAGAWGCCGAALRYKSL
jgi:hypothetical protein